ncbi:Transcriptional regulator, contains HTH domain [Halalkaliarchaeum sp. AArc-CO]|uniref:helix-turn-helix domain-containing protein n=1 Tax=unclassified Halalkaliarchaeum TaxID=2678344 RepID=UPI00217D897B|nr:MULTISPECIES: helix-turn-helix domain-containing protein [unclassified Halalkaliarchaeum]MDR5673098.1 helix-turn-helix domain-containing protein [Halalkaliarchaeum sp. AArc-GB]UWG49576.1 Transcriptional regulator, contains HTH domain [Halalkaliarchaeum sp. AArc-CO]
MGSGTAIGKLLGDSRELRAELSVRLPDDHPCPLTDACSCVTEIETASLNGDCHLITKASTGRESVDSVQYVSTDVEESCFCNAFTEHQCVAVITDRKQGELIVETYPPDRLTLMDVVRDVSEIAEVSVRQLSLVSKLEGPHELETVNVSRLTDLERETIDWAIEQGYYERPREIGLDEIADEFGVSKSSISQRLSSAERKLVLEAMG